GQYKWWKYINRPKMEIKYADKIEQSARFVSAASASSTADAPVSFKGKTAESISVEGATQSIIRTNSVGLQNGRFFTPTEAQRGARVAIVGTSVVDALFESGSALGKYIRIKGNRFFVIGVYENQCSFFGQDRNNRITIPIKAFQQIMGKKNIQIAVKYPSDKAYERGKYEIEGVMRRIRNLSPLQENNFAINKPEAFEKAYNNMTYAIFGIGIFLTSLALFIGGIGVIHIMLVSVKKRTKEIGLRKAVGAKAWEILFQFLIEAVIICMVGGILGVLLSILATIGIQQIF